MWFWVGRSLEKFIRMSFDSLGLRTELLRAVSEKGYHKPTPIQHKARPLILEGRDIMGGAQTGTGKTAGFTLPLLQRLMSRELISQDKLKTGRRTIRALVLTPTRELAAQVAESVVTYGKHLPLRSTVIFGGVNINPQIQKLRTGVDILVATPGRLLDHVGQRTIDLSNVDILVLDEADRMLDIGFRPDIEKILRRCPTERQTLLLSATMPPSVERLAKKYMRDSKRVDLSEDGIAVDTIEQYYATVDNDRKFGLLVRLLAKERPQQAIVFARTKRGTEQLYRKFSRRLAKTAMMNGDLPQSQRDCVMQNFRDGKVRLLIATDVCGRGLDISGISHIINYDIPEYHDDYVHRVGRTGRLSSDVKGWAVTFVTREQGEHLTNIEKRINTMLPEYKVEGFEAFRPQPPRQRVNDRPKRNDLHVA